MSNEQFSSMIVWIEPNSTQMAMAMADLGDNWKPSYLQSLSVHKYNQVAKVRNQ